MRGGEGQWLESISLRAGRREDIDAERNSSALVRLQRAYTDDASLELFAAIIADRYDDRILPGARSFLGMLERTFDAQR